MGLAQRAGTLGRHLGFLGLALTRPLPQGLVAYWFVGENGFYLTVVPSRLPGLRLVWLGD
jgi:hypothetical protein